MFYTKKNAYFFCTITEGIINDYRMFILLYRTVYYDMEE